MSETSSATPVFTTARLDVRVATAADVALFLALWNDPATMAPVGFPAGLRMSRADILKRLARRPATAPLDTLLVAVERTTGEAVGECFMHRPTDDGIADTDIKLLPAFRGRGFGTEIKRGLVRYLFNNTAAIAVQATPNMTNAGSIRMQEKIGGVRVGEIETTFPPALAARLPTQPGRHHVYHIYRDMDRVKRAATCLVVRDGSVLLGRKRRGFGQGKIVTIGGMIQAGETTADAARRELAEETTLGVETASLRHAADIQFWFPWRPEWHLHMTVFTADRVTGTATVTEEIAPDWFPCGALPLATMWDDARLWLPTVLAGAAVSATFVYGPDNEHVRYHTVNG